jgi:hypothetical protein
VDMDVTIIDIPKDHRCLNWIMVIAREKFKDDNARVVFSEDKMKHVKLDLLVEARKEREKDKDLFLLRFGDWDTFVAKSTNEVASTDTWPEHQELILFSRAHPGLDFRACHKDKDGKITGGVSGTSPAGCKVTKVMFPVLENGHWSIAAVEKDGQTQYLINPEDADAVGAAVLSRLAKSEALPKKSGDTDNEIEFKENMAAILGIGDVELSFTQVENRNAKKKKKAAKEVEAQKAREDGGNDKGGNGQGGNGQGGNGQGGNGKGKGKQAGGGKGAQGQSELGKIQAQLNIALQSNDLQAKQLATLQSQQFTPPLPQVHQPTRAWNQGHSPQSALHPPSSGPTTK